MKKILIVKIGAIGDVVMSLPLLHALHKNHSPIHITWIAGKTVAPLIEATGLVDRLIAVDESKLLAGSFFEKSKALLFLWKQIWNEHFEQALLLHSDIRYRAILFPIRCKDKRSWGKNGKRHFPIPGRYHADEAVHLLAAGEGPSSLGLTFPELRLNPSPHFKRFESKPVIVLAPGGAKNVLADDLLRRWPIGHYVELAEGLLRFPFHVVLVGSESDRWVLSHFDHLPIHSLVGLMNLLELISFLKEASFLITHDSGPLHLAKLAKCPTLALFGPTNPAEKVSPKEKIHVLWGGEHLSCRPCYSGKNYASCSDNRCLGDVKPSRVLDEIPKLLYPK